MISTGGISLIWVLVLGDVYSYKEPFWEKKMAKKASLLLWYCQALNLWAPKDGSLWIATFINWSPSSLHHASVNWGPTVCQALRDTNITKIQWVSSGNHVSGSLGRGRQVIKWLSDLRAFAGYLQRAVGSLNLSQTGPRWLWWRKTTELSHDQSTWGGSMLSKKREEPVQRLTGLKASAQWVGDTRKDEPPIEELILHSVVRKPHWSLRQPNSRAILSGSFNSVLQVLRGIGEWVHCRSLPLLSFQACVPPLTSYFLSSTSFSLH